MGTTLRTWKMVPLFWLVYGLYQRNCLCFVQCEMQTVSNFSQGVDGITSQHLRTRNDQKATRHTLNRETFSCYP